MKTITIETYGILELPEEAYRFAMEENWDWNMRDVWYDNIYNDAKTIGLKITGFDLDGRAYCKGELTASSKEVATNILREHGKETDTYKLAEEYSKNWPAKTEEEQEEKDENFKEQLCADDWYCEVHYNGDTFTKDSMDSVEDLFNDILSYHPKAIENAIKELDAIPF